MRDKKLTIGIPVYNKSAQITRTLLSIVNSGTCTHDGLAKILLVDDCSTDDSATVSLQALRDLNQDFDLIALKLNEGVSHARNLIISNCDTDYLTFVDADDELFPSEFFRLINSEILKDNNYDLIICNIAQVSEHTNSVRILSPIEESRELSVSDLASLVTEYLNAPNRNGILSQCFGKIFSTKFLHSKNLYFLESLCNYEDVEFMGSFLTYLPHCAQVRSCFYRYINYALGSTESYSSSRPISTHTGFLSSIPKMKLALQTLESGLRLNHNTHFYKSLEDNAISVLTFITVVCHAHKSNNLARMFLFYRELKELFNQKRIQEAIWNYDFSCVPNGSPILTYLCRYRLIFLASIVARFKYCQRYGSSGISLATYCSICAFLVI